MHRNGTDQPTGRSLECTLYQHVRLPLSKSVKVPAWGELCLEKRKNPNTYCLLTPHCFWRAKVKLRADPSRRINQSHVGDDNVDAVLVFRGNNSSSHAASWLDFARNSAGPKFGRILQHCSTANASDIKDEWDQAHLHRVLIRGRSRRHRFSAVPAAVRCAKPKYNVLELRNNKFNSHHSNMWGLYVFYLYAVMLYLGPPMQLRMLLVCDENSFVSLPQRTDYYVGDALCVDDSVMIFLQKNAYLMNITNREYVSYIFPLLYILLPHTRPHDRMHGVPRNTSLVFNTFDIFRFILLRFRSCGWDSAITLGTAERTMMM